ncbi:hypothetical protein T484DRAFT_1816213 [Baffinella frigidus]|nr:hypothetical protein T484DRAFT_1816213 [Cryptophyta sp. CCMP2293]
MAGKGAKISGGGVQGGKAGLGKNGELSVDKFVEDQLAMVEIEREAEEGQTKADHEGLTLKQLEEKGVVLSSLAIWERKQGLGGRTLITLARDRALSSKEQVRQGGKGDGQGGKGDGQVLPHTADYQGFP